MKKLKILETSRTLKRASRFLSAVKNPKLRILEVTTYTSGVCGVAARVLAEAALLAEHGHEVRIFSTNHVKGSSALASTHEQRNNVTIRRFPALKIAGESYTLWSSRKLKKAIRAYRPDIIIAHSYRHTHTLLAYRIAKEIGAKSILVAHAPFGDTSMRSPLAAWYIQHFDKHQGKRSLQGFDKIVAITHWELPYLHNLGASKEKIAYLPNGIPPAFFTQKPAKEQPTKLLFFGRIAPVKDIETLLEALSRVKNQKVTLELAGPAEADYLTKLKKLILDLHLEHRVSFTPALFETSKKIAKLDSAHLFILPSKREGMPQSLIEAMARKKLVIASETLGARDLIRNSNNGFLFPIGNASALATTIDSALALSPTQKRSMQNAAHDSVKQFAWPLIGKKLELLLQDLAKK